MARRGKADPRSDETLVRLCNQGDAAAAAQAFEALYRRHKDYVVRVALRFVRDPDAALDVLQETFSYLLRKFPPAGEGLTLTAPMTTFLYPVVKHCALTLSRKEHRFSADDVHDPDDQASEPPAADLPALRGWWGAARPCRRCRRSG
ncbi:MAG TPA: sigma-70 family RNA polymerase sigma factor [Gammaproteobacteria bacterium]